jgi:cytochrome c6
VIPTVGQASITYVDAVGLRKANESANVTLAEQVAPDAQRFRKAGNTCVRANEAAVPLTPPACAGQRACRDANGALVCTGCRTFANGCGDYEQTRLYATITDPGLKAGGGGGGGGGNAAVLAQGKQLFQQNCGTCHTLADAGTNGKIGPVLDDVKPDKQLVLSAIKNGGLGSGTMPANIVTGKDAEAVATYVSTVAGK